MVVRRSAGGSGCLGVTVDETGDGVGIGSECRPVGDRLVGRLHGQAALLMVTAPLTKVKV